METEKDRIRDKKIRMMICLQLIAFIIAGAATGWGCSFLFPSPSLCARVIAGLAGACVLGLANAAYARFYHRL